ILFANSPAGSDYAQLLSFIPPGNDATGSVFQGSSPGPVKIDQFSGDLFFNLSAKDNLHAYYAWQQDQRTEPNLQGNTIPGFGDHRGAHRQIGTLNEVHIFNPNIVNEARLGFNRIAISFVPNTPANPLDYGIQNGVSYNAALPQMTVQDIGLNFGGPSGFPQGRFDTTLVFSDTLSWNVGRHTIKTGGEYRRFIADSFAQTPGIIAFSSTANFIRGLASSFSVTPTQVTSRIFENAIGVYISDNYKFTPRLQAELGFRFEWNGTPTDGGNRLVNFDQNSASLVHVSEAYNQNYNYEPRVGFIYDVLGTGKTILRGGFGLLADEPVSGVVTGLAGNPPNANPVAETGSLFVGTLYSSAALASLAPSATNPLLSNAYTESYSFNLQQQIGWDAVMEVGYIGSEGKHLRIQRNLNQFIYPGGTSTRPYPFLSSSSPIRPGSGLGNIPYVDSDSLSNYNALWFTVRKALSHGIQLNSTYAWSKSMDLNSLGSQGGYTLQDNFNPKGDYGLSDFDARNHFAFSGIWNLPFKGNRLVDGWMLANITQLQSGNPLNVTTTSTYNGVSGTIRPTLLSNQYQTGRGSVLASGNVSYIRARVCLSPTVPGCNFYPQTAGFGNLSRNALTGPGFADVDLSLQKTTKITESTSLVLRVDSFDLLNHANLGNPTLSATGSPTSTFGQISSTRTAVGDAGSSRQLQFAARFQF
ncbi:MAG: hypothetical protein WA869_11645, partial [Alloacidobacterium sp.]